MNVPTNCIYLLLSVSVSLQRAGGGVCFVSEDVFATVASVFRRIHYTDGGTPERIDQPMWSALDMAFGLLGCHMSSAEVLKGLKPSSFQAGGAYLRRSTDLYLAAGGCILLIFL